MTLIQTARCQASEYAVDVANVNFVEIEARLIALESPDTDRPRLTYSAAGAINVAAAPGKSSTVKLTLQDGVQRSFPGTLSWAFANGAADLGLDIGSEAVSTWYHLYAVPSMANDAILTVRASVSEPATGPTSYSNWHYLGAFRNDAAGNIVKFYQPEKNVFNYYVHTEGTASLALSTTKCDPKITLTLTDVIPVTAVCMFGQLIMQHNVTANYNVWNEIYVDGETVPFQECYTGNSYQWNVTYLHIPTPTTPKQIQYKSADNGGAGIAYQAVDTLGWIDGYL